MHPTAPYRIIYEPAERMSINTFDNIDLGAADTK